MKKDKVKIRRATRIKYQVIRELGLNWMLCRTNIDLARQISFRMKWTQQVTKANCHDVILRYWAETHGDAPVPIRSKAAKATQQARKAFYESQDWQTLRYMALKKHGAACCCCGATAKSSGKPLHVDHIKPRSRFPELELKLENLQVLCHDCNLGKGAWDDTDWRDPNLALDAEYRGILQ